MFRRRTYEEPSCNWNVADDRYTFLGRIFGVVGGDGRKLRGSQRFRRCWGLRIIVGLCAELFGVKRELDWNIRVSDFVDAVEPQRQRLSSSIPLTHRSKERFQFANVRGLEPSEFQEKIAGAYVAPCRRATRFDRSDDQYTCVVSVSDFFGRTVFERGSDRFPVEHILAIYLVQLNGGGLARFDGGRVAPT